MTKLQLALYLVISGVLLILAKEAAAYDLQCSVMHKEDVKHVLGTDKRQYLLKFVSDEGLKTTIFVKDMLVPSQVEDYVKYTNGKETMTYALHCEKF